MKITKHVLTGRDGTPLLKGKPSPNTSGILEKPRFLVMHYTAGSTMSGAVATLRKRSSKASAHLVIDRDGTIAQVLPFNKIAWHAGRSRWRGFKGLNRYSIGVELVNAGPLKKSNGTWRAWFGGTFEQDDVVEALHKHGGDDEWWHEYPEKQLRAAISACQLIVDQYGLKDVIGHDDIAPERKRDPGPAFPMDSFRASVLGRAQDDDDLHETISRLNIRSGPGTEFEPIRAKPLPVGTRLNLISTDSNWCYVEVLKKTDGAPNETGWVYGDYIRPLWDDENDTA